MRRRIVLHEPKTGEARTLVLALRSLSDIAISRVIVWATEQGGPAAAPPLCYLDSFRFALNLDGGPGAPDLQPRMRMRLGATLSLSPRDWACFGAGRGVGWHVRTTPEGEAVHIEEISINGHRYYKLAETETEKEKNK